MANTNPVRQLKKDAAGILLLIVAIFLTASLLGRDPADRPTDSVYPPNPVATNWCGPLGAIASRFLIDWLGLGAFVVCLTANGLAWSCFRQASMGRLLRHSVGYALVTLTAAIFIGRISQTLDANPDLSPRAWLHLPSMATPTDGDSNTGASVGSRFTIHWTPPVAGDGGIFGLLFSNWLDAGLSRLGSTIVLLPLLIFGYLLTNDPLIAGIAWLFATVGTFFVHSVVTVGSLPSKAVQAKPEKVKTAKAAKPDLKLHLEPESEEVSDDGAVEDEEEESAAAEEPARGHPLQEIKIVRTGIEPIVPRAQPTVNLTFQPGFDSPLPSQSNVRLPDLDILEDSPPFDFGNIEQEIRERAKLVESTFAEFDMQVQVVQIDTGPVVTQYEIKLEPGLRASKVIALADDLAIALRATAVRIVAPIPGKNTVGIEVPNERRAKVTLKEVITKAPANSGTMRLPLYLGKDVKGQPLVCDLANMPHLLIAGRTGTGKSVCLNALILSILMSRTPDQVKMLMIDPKMVELSLYKDIPHLLHPVVTDMKKAEALLGWAVDKMEERYDLLARVGVRHIDSFNKLSYKEILDRIGTEDESEKALIPEQLPYILIFADEMADLMMTAAKEVEAHIIRLAQKARAVGIHLILATQKPTVDVITGLIKSNLPARIAFQVASRVDSAVVLDEKGAEKLLGNGDMLFLYPGTSKIIRAQGTFVSDEEVTKVVEYLCSQAKPQYSQELMQLQSSVKTGGDVKNLSDRDDMYEAAIDVVVREQRGSVSLLQRALGIGYGRGARLIDYMAEDGIVGTYNGSQAREVLYSTEEWEETKRTRWGKAG